MVPVIVGPTAAGKSALAIALAERYSSVEIISADSRQIYIGMDIGTAKPSPADRSRVHHHLINIVTPDVAYSAGRYAAAARAAIDDVLARKRIPLVVGGSGFYIQALFEGLGAPEVDAAIIARLEARVEQEGYDAIAAELSRVDPVAAAAHSANNGVKTLRALACYLQTGTRYSEYEGAGALGAYDRRPRYVGVAPDRGTLYGWINARAVAMVDAGLVDETRALLAAGIAADAPGLRTVGYKEAIAHLAGTIDEVAMTALIQQSTRRYAKRQMTWFRRIADIEWFDPRTADVESVAGTLGLDS